jgi:hypothetical protein
MNGRLISTDDEIPDCTATFSIAIAPLDFNPIAQHLQEAHPRSIDRDDGIVYNQRLRGIPRATGGSNSYLRWRHSAYIKVSSTLSLVPDPVAGN